MAHPRGLDEDLIGIQGAPGARLSGRFHAFANPLAQASEAKSAGRVQSVALRLIVDRESEIELFKSQEYWQVSANFEADSTPFNARLVALDGNKLDRLSIGDKGSADAAKKVVEDGRFTVVSVETKPLSKNPAALHHLDLAAGSGAQARLRGQPRAAARPVAL